MGSDTTLDSAAAIGKNRCGLEILIRQDLGLRPREKLVKTIFM